MAGRGGTGGLGGSSDQSKGLDGVAPKVLDAFLSAQVRKPTATDELAQGLFAETKPTGPPEAPGQFKSRPSAEVLAESRARIRELVAAAQAAGPRGGPGAPPAPLMPTAAPGGPGPVAPAGGGPAGGASVPGAPTKPEADGPSGAGDGAAGGPGGAGPTKASAALAAFGRSAPASPEAKGGAASGAGATAGTPSGAPGTTGGGAASPGGPGAPGGGPGAPGGAQGLPGGGPGGGPGAPGGDLKAQFMAMRQGVQPKGDAPSAGPPKAGRTGPLEAGDAMKLAHLALRNQAQRTNDPEGADASAAKVEAVVAQRMGTEGVKALRETFAAIQDAALPGKLQELSLRVNQLVPGVNTMDLGLDVGKRMVVNSLNPVLAITVGLAESAERIKKLQDWGNLTPQERLSNVANLTGNLAEILGALTPPPLNVGVQALGAGMALVGLASEHLEVGEVSKALGRHENVRRTANQMADGASSAASRVSEAWGELSDRLEASRLKRPKLPAPMQSLFGSPTWGKLKAWEATAPIAEGTENVAHNLSKSIERQVASVESSWQALKGKLGGGPPAPKAKVPGKGQKAKPKPGAEEVAAPSEIDQAAAQAEGPTP